jgi:xylose isomerase
MPKITITNETRDRLVAFQPVVRAVLEQEMTLDQMADMLILSAITTALDNLWGKVEPVTLVQSLHALAQRHPKEVFAFVAARIAAGDETQREQTRNYFGFRPPEQ